MYEGCILRYSGNEAWYDCTSPQNSQCQGSQRCESLDKTSTPAPVTGGGANASVDCPAGQHHSDLNNQVLTNCVANANANDNLNVNGNDNSNNNNNGSSSTATAVAYGGAGGSANVNISGLGGGGTREVRTVEYRNVGVGTSAPVYYAGVKQLPATGLPVLAWTALGLIPTGFGMRRFSGVKKEAEKNPNYLWEDRQFKVGD